MRPDLSWTSWIVLGRLDECQTSTECSDSPFCSRSVGMIVDDNIQRLIWLIGAIKSDSQLLICRVVGEFKGGPRRQFHGIDRHDRRVQVNTTQVSKQR